ncbi:methionine--tRNA ligase, partial [Candidatus Woesearchaeota archaeon]|nr:methionine--tRNA ligase [Candidatus Woesearchaeota archaeon]
KKKYTAKYCVGCERFLLDKEITKGCCEIHPGKKLETISEENYFFKLSKYKNKLITLIKTDKYKIQPKAAKNEILSFLRGKVRDVSFSREKSRLPWGIPVPGDNNQVIYVWADALPNYITGIGYGSNSAKFKKWWPAQFHIVGKDISRFHAIYWPAMLLSAGLATPKELLVHGFINDEKGRKMSKSIGNVIDPFDQINTYDLDTVRYYFLRSIPSNQDGNYSETDLIDRHNAELVNTLGNLLSRSLNLIEKSGGKVPAGKYDVTLKKEYNQALKKLNESIVNFDFHHGVAAVWKYISKVNQYVDKTKPWTLDGKKKEKVLYNLAESLRLISALTYPIIPNASEEIAKQLGIKKVPLIKSDTIKVGTKINKGKHLFSKI